MSVVSFYKGSGEGVLAYSQAHAGAICFDAASRLIYLNGEPYGGGDVRMVTDVDVVKDEKDEHYGEIKVEFSEGEAKYVKFPEDIPALVEAIEGLQKDVEELQAKDEELAEAIEELKKTDVVEWVPSSADRKHIVLANHDSILGQGANCLEGQENGYEGGENLEGSSVNLVMLSKWNVADFGSSKVKLNLNSKDGIVTINDSERVATEEWVEAQGYLKEHQDLSEYAKLEAVQKMLEELPADLVVSGGSVVVNPEGEEEGTYLELELSNGEKVYIAATDLVDTYQGSQYIDVNNYTVSLKADDLKTDLGIASLASKDELEAVDGKVDAVDTLVKDNVAAIAGIKDELYGHAASEEGDEPVAAKEGLVDLVSALRADVDQNAEDIKDLQDALEGLDDLAVKLSAAIGEVPGEEEGQTVARYAKDASVHSVLSDMDARIAANAASIAAAVAGGVTSVVAGDGISVNSANSTQPVVSLKLDANTNLKINDNKELSFVWIEE